jgi:hypothetical protein
MFCGSQCDGLEVNSNKLGMFIRTDPNFAMTYMRLVDYFTLASAPDFDIVHDLTLINGNDALVCGTITELSTSSTCTTTVSRPFVAKIDLVTGLWVGTNYWVNTEFKGADENVGSRVLYNGGNQVVMATNGEGGSGGALIFYNFLTGAFLYGKWAEFAQYPMNFGTQLKHQVFIQNIYYNTDGNLFISGKYLKSAVTWNATAEYDMPVSAIFNKTTKVFTNLTLYPTDMTYIFPLDILNYYATPVICNTRTRHYCPIYSASNTVLATGIPNNEYVTVTHDKTLIPGNSSFPYKTWIYSNDNLTCLNYSPSIPIINPPLPTSQITLNSQLGPNPDVLNINYYNLANYPLNIFNCDSDPN